ncbi:hypothetical protein FB470_000083 [Amycolatopsis thermophila]|uniref:Lipoprotein n=1 Tax=Amycolatopsis thermophila TaxID=206084 RepID=A0ABU0ELN1_9PSEU|nr:hypothetical protein [Amycolatopsis thermophila]
MPGNTVVVVLAAGAAACRPRIDATAAEAVRPAHPGQRGRRVKDDRRRQPAGPAEPGGHGRPVMRRDQA